MALRKRRTRVSAARRSRRPSLPRWGRLSEASASSISGKADLWGLFIYDCRSFTTYSHNYCETRAVSIGSFPDKWFENGSRGLGILKGLAIRKGDATKSRLQQPG